MENNERRTEYPKILDSLSEIKDEIIDARLEAKRIAVLVEERNTSALSFRTDVCKKFDRIFLWLEKLPCKERSGIYDSVKRQLAIIWVVVSCVIVAVFAEWIKLK